MAPRFIIFCCIFAAVFGFSLYLLACTASIYPDYQPDIGRIRWLQPALVLVVFFIGAWFLAQRQTELRVFLLITLAECAAIFLIVLVADLSHDTVSATRPDERRLWTTVMFALRHPQFSNRSYGAPLYSAIVAGILWLIYRSRLRHSE
jgi:multisubunit Na+/H+ antiporter MnhC subunit